jgi:hypothetical protein
MCLNYGIPMVDDDLFGVDGFNFYFFFNLFSGVRRLFVFKSDYLL